MVKRFRWLLLPMILTMLCAQGCVPTAVQPTATPEPTAQAAASAALAQPMILVLPSPYQKPMIAVNRHYSTVLKNKGWNIDFYTVKQEYSGDGVDSYLQYVTAQLASGVAKADGYFLSTSLLQDKKQAFEDLKSQGLLFDCAGAAQRAAPDYWARWKDRIADSAYGLPLCREIMTDGDDYALCVRQDTVAEVREPLETFSDLRALVERLAGPPTKGDPKPTAGTAEPTRGGFRLCASFSDWLACWALERGYMEVGSGLLQVYVGVDDADARPVLLEDIPGFQDFLDDYLSLRSRGALVDLTWYSDPGQDVDLGNALLLSDSLLYYPNPEGLSLRNFHAYSLYRGQRHASSILFAFLREHPNLYADMLTIPAASRRAEEAMAFVQWVTEAQENADAVLYGQLGEDYELQEQRVALREPLRSAVNRSLREDNSVPYAFYALFAGVAQRRLPVEAPENAEAVLSERRPLPLAAPWLTGLFAHILDLQLTPQAGVDAPPEDLAQARYTELDAFISLRYGSSEALPTGEELQRCFHGKSSDALLQWYRQRIDRVRTKAIP